MLHDLAAQEAGTAFQCLLALENRRETVFRATPYCAELQPQEPRLPQLVQKSQPSFLMTALV